MKFQYIIFALMIVIMLGSAAAVLADTITLPNPLCPTGGGPNCVRSFPELGNKILGYISDIVGVLATVMLVWAGILYVTSGGDPGKAGKAKQTVIYAIIGLAIALAGRGLVGVINSVITG